MESTTGPKPFVFVLMPFDDAFIDVYQLGIKPACEAAGAYCERVDEQIFVESILERVYNQIAKADVIVSEMTGRNPNVFYETGYAHALNKRAILLTQDADDIPFDLKHYPHIVYEGKIHLLKTELEARVHWCIENPTRSLSDAELDIQFSIEGVLLSDNPMIWIRAPTELVREPIRVGSEAEQTRVVKEFELRIGVHNPTNKRVSSSNYDLALITPLDLKVYKAPKASYNKLRSIKLPDGTSMLKLPDFDSLFPSAWDVISVVLESSSGISALDMYSSEKMVLRVFTEVGSRDYPFRLCL